MYTWAESEFLQDSTGFRFWQQIISGKSRKFLSLNNLANYCFILDERCGNLVVVVNNEDAVTKVQSQIEKIVSCMYLNPVNHGARVVSTILNDESLTQEW